MGLLLTRKMYSNYLGLFNNRNAACCLKLFRREKYAPVYYCIIGSYRLVTI